MDKQMKKKERKLTSKENERIKALKIDAQRREAKFRASVVRLEQERDDAIRAAIRINADIVRDLNVVYQVEKRQVDEWKVSKEKQVQQEYHARLADARRRKSFAYNWAEFDIEVVREKQELIVRAELEQLAKKMDAFLVKNRAAQERIRDGSKNKQTGTHKEDKEQEHKAADNG